MVHLLCGIFCSPFISIFDPLLSPLPTLHVHFSIIIVLQQDKNIVFLALVFW